MNKEEMRYDKEGEAKQVIEEVSAKFSYTQELSDLLLKIYNRVYGEASYEIKQNFFQILREVPIVVVDKMTPELYNQLQDEYLGKDRVQEREEENQYNSQFAPGAYVSTPVLDQDRNLIGKRSFLYVERLGPYFDEIIKKLGTDIHIPHLLHELGRAQAARKNEYTQQGNKVRMRCGMAQKEYVIELKDGKTILNEKESQGIYLEEAINTVIEYENVAKFLGIDPEDVDFALYTSTGRYSLVPSNYHGLMDSIGKRMQKVIGKKQLEQIRIFDDKKVIEEFNRKAQNTKYWRQGAHSEEEMEKKKEVFGAPKSEAWREFCNKNQDTYFGIHKEETPIQRIDNVLRQIYDMKTAKYNIPLEDYKKIINAVLGEAYYILNGIKLDAKRDIGTKEQE